MIYLACPYSHDDPGVREERFRAVARAAGQLLASGEIVFAPVVYSRTLSVQMPDMTEADWLRIDRAFFDVCGELAVLALDGWKESRGVREEIQWALETGKPVRLLDPSKMPAPVPCIPEGVP